MDKIVERFKRYITVDTKADPNSETVPSTKGQLELGKILVEELNELGREDWKLVGVSQFNFMYGITLSISYIFIRELN